MRKHQKTRHTGSTGLIAAVLLFVLLLSCGCAKRAAAKQVDTSLYLGEYSYDAPMTAMVYEDLDGEGKGVLYREVTDYEKMIAYSPVPICIYFYSSLAPDTGMTAGIEDMAEFYHDKILFVSVDANQEKDLADHFEVTVVPDFVILNNGSLIAHYSGKSGELLAGEDLKKWILDNAKIS
jgi:hypothetical protein